MKKILLVLVLFMGIGSNLNAQTEEEKNCENGNIADCVSVAYKAYREKDFTKAMKHFSKGCKANWSEACYSLAGGYQDGEGVKKDINKAKEYYIKSCRLDPDGFYCFYLGRNYKNGEFGEKNPLKAKEAYYKGCKLSHGPSCLELGSMYKEEKNYAKAKEYYYKTCNMGEGSWGCKEYQELKLAEPEVLDCEILKMRFLSCVKRSYEGLECLPGTDIVLPKECQ